MMNKNLPQTGSYSTWAWTGNASVALEPGPHVVTLCFIAQGSVSFHAHHDEGTTFLGIQLRLPTRISRKQN